MDATRPLVVEKRLVAGPVWERITVTPASALDFPWITGSLEPVLGRPLFNQASADAPALTTGSRPLPYIASLPISPYDKTSSAFAISVVPFQPNP